MSLVGLINNVVGDERSVLIGICLQQGIYDKMYVINPAKQPKCFAERSDEISVCFYDRKELLVTEFGTEVLTKEGAIFCALNGEVVNDNPFISASEQNSKENDELLRVIIMDFLGEDTDYEPMIFCKEISEIVDISVQKIETVILKWLSSKFNGVIIDDNTGLVIFERNSEIVVVHVTKNGTCYECSTLINDYRYTFISTNLENVRKDYLNELARY